MTLLHKNLKVIILGILILLTNGLFAQDKPISAIEDDSRLRINIKDAWLMAEPSFVAKNLPINVNLPGGTPVRVHVETRANELIVYLARERNGSYPGWAQGSWVYTRDLRSGSPIRIRLFLRSDPQTYIQFRPMGIDKSQADVVLYDAYIIRGLPLGFSIERLLTMPFEEALAAMGNRFPRRYFEPDLQKYRTVAPTRTNPNNNLIARLRNGLKSLKYEDDGAIDSEGQYVYIKNGQPMAKPGLNCSGFAKWVVDGILRPVTGTTLDIEPLKEPPAPRTSSLIANYEDRDYFFGLDWTRNLGLEAARVLRSPDFASLENIEVRKETFTSYIDRSSGTAVITNYPGFLLNAGFAIEGLRPLLYTLAINEPGTMYLASVNRERGRAPHPRQHYHVAILIPYFNEFGVFQIAVFESAAETNIAGFISRHPKAMINLVRVPIEGVFTP